MAAIALPFSVQATGNDQDFKQHNKIFPLLERKFFLRNCKIPPRYEKAVGGFTEGFHDFENKLITNEY